jgi:Concanavalin A-like lectin/glucanases superfamily
MKRISLVISILSFFILNSCQQSNPVISPSTPLEKTGVSIHILMKDAPSDVASIVGVLTRTGYDTLKNGFSIVNDTATCEFSNISAGTWHLQVSAYDASNTLTYAGATDVQVSPGVATPVSLVLDPATGSILVTVTWGTNGNRSLIFDGTSGYVEMLNSASLMNIDSAITLEAWIKPQDNPSRFYHYIIGKGVTLPVYSMELINPSLNPAFTLTGLTVDYTGAGSYWSRLVLNETISNQSWTHVAMTFSNEVGLTVYINGDLAYHTSATGYLTHSNDNLRIGVLLNETYQLYFKGLIDEVRIWKIARTAAQIKDNMGKELTGTEPGLVGYWNFNDSYGSMTVSDKSGNENSGTLHGGVGFSNDTPF